MRRKLLSKSLFKASEPCQKKLVLLAYHRHLGTEATNAWAQSGDEIGQLARLLFPDGVTLGGVGKSPEELAADTKEAMEGPRQALFEATFLSEDLVCRADIVARHPLGGWHLIEVKSGKSLKPEYLQDLAFQSLVLTQAGIDLTQVSLAHVNPDYIYPGGAIVPEQFFHLEDVTALMAEEIPNLLPKVEKALELIRSSAIPLTEVNTFCRSPFPCPFYDHCHKDVHPHSVHFLTGLNRKKVDEFRSEEKRLITDLTDRDISQGFQRRIRDSLAKDRTLVDRSLPTTLAKLQWPLVFVDFEAISPAIPLYPGTKSFQRMAFQFSCHTVADPHSNPEPGGFLHPGGERPDSAFIQALTPFFQKAGTIVYYSDFEVNLLKSLSQEGIPGAADCETLIRRKGLDLYKLIKQGIYSPAFDFSFSIKDVLPALVPHLSYDSLAIQDGDAAAKAWIKMTAPTTSTEDASEIEQNLLTYCSLDTLAMVELVKVLRTFEATV
ncbi:MAG: DUF2779 domain-containing protein [Fimbriimonadaceae bacterium]|jgi:hypothetical protein|nr:DUF2779 domain-containing protein [Fimbriimonadaceae bacterium]